MSHNYQGNLVFLHTTELHGEWRIWEGLMMRSYGNVEHLICFVENSKIRTDIARHHSKRNSDQYFVWPHEVATMIENIEKDYAKRQLWEKAYNDAQNLKLLNFHLNKPTP